MRSRMVGSLAYTAVQAPMIVGLMRARAPLRSLRALAAGRSALDRHGRRRHRCSRVPCLRTGVSRITVCCNGGRAPASAPFWVTPAAKASPGRPRTANLTSEALSSPNVTAAPTFESRSKHPRFGHLPGGYRSTRAGRGQALQVDRHDRHRQEHGDSRKSWREHWRAATAR